MLKKVFDEKIDIGKKLSDVNSLSPFVSGLEYSCPARGTWNIVHTGFLVPESHQIFVCASNCLRGVVLTAAEMGMSDRFSTITIKENNVLDGNMEELLIDGVRHILEKLKSNVKAVLIYTSCIHHFMALDMDYCFTTLRKEFPKVRFTDCYMNPIMRKSGMTPDEIMRRQLYSFIENNDKKDNGINICGNNIKTDETSELIRLIKMSKYKLRDITICRSFKEYLDMGKSRINVTYLPVAKKGMDEISKKLGQKNLYLELSFNALKIKKNLKELADNLEVDISKFDYREDVAYDTLKKAKKIIGDMPISIDYTFTPSTLSLAKLLLDNGFNVKRIYIDNITEGEVLQELQSKYNDRDIFIYPTVNAKMRVIDRNESEKYLALGQKAAYFTDSKNFVNEVECGGHYGFDGIKRLATNMIDAYRNEKDTSKLIQMKGLGCNSLI